MARKEFYSQKNHSVLVDGFPLSDFAEGDDVISFEPQGDGVTNQRGLDKNNTNFGSARPGWLTVQLKPTSPAIDILDQLIRNQENGNPRLMNVSVLTGVAEALSVTGCGIEEQGFGTGGPVGTPRTYIFKGANYRKFPFQA